MITYLDAMRRRVEIYISTGGAVYGLGQLAQMALGFGEPLYWLGLSPSAQAWLLLGIGCASLVHLSGIVLNGASRFSPLIRAIGLGAHALFLTWVSLLTIGLPETRQYGVPSGFWSYSILAFGVWHVTGEALADLRRVKHA